MSAYDKNMKAQKDETARIAAIKAPIDVGVMQGHDKERDTAAEHWTLNMPDHIIKNDVGPTAAWDSPAPPKKEASDKPADTAAEAKK